MVYAAGIVLVLATMVVGRFVWPTPDTVRQIGWDTLAVAVVGLAAVLLQPAAGFPSLLDPEVRAARRVWLPALAGLAFGVADVVVFEVIVRTAAHTELPPYLQPFPYSLLLYPSGAWYIETLYRLLPLTVGMALARRFLPRAAWTPVFVLLAVATSVVEPLNQLIASPLWLTIYGLVTGLAMNLLQALLYRRGGWLASLSVRLGHYLIWHILLGLYVELIVLS